MTKESSGKYNQENWYQNIIPKQTLTELLILASTVCYGQGTQQLGYFNHMWQIRTTTGEIPQRQSLHFKAQGSAWIIHTSPQSLQKVIL